MTLVLAGASCTTPSTHSSPAQPIGLIGIEWVLDNASLRSLVTHVPADVRIDMRFQGDQASGSSGCNTYGATVGAIGGSITFGPIRVTAIGCEQPVMRLEAAYLRALEGSTAYDATKTTLHLTGGPVDLVFTATPPSASPTP